jgi:tryptophan synthase beta chain
MGERVKFELAEEQIPTSWVNLIADLPGDPPPPPLSPATGEPVGPDDLAALFPMALIEQEVSAEPEIEIPDEIRDIYRLWRPTPLFRARRSSAKLDTPAHIYYKYEGSRRLRLPQAEHRRCAGVLQPRGRRIPEALTETGARAVGVGLVPCLPVLRAGVRGLHGRYLVRPSRIARR